MYRIALAVILGIAPLLIAYGQFRALPGHESASLDLMGSVRDALIVCVTVDASELCPIPLDYLSQANTLPNATTIIFLVAAKFAMLLAFA
jgi:hypothetical protein